MKTFKIEVFADNCVARFRTMALLPDYFSSNEVNSILEKYTRKYCVYVSEPWENPDVKISIKSMEKLIKTIESVKLYKEEEVLERDTVAEIKEVKLPSDMTVSLKHEFRDNSRHLTFFECSKVVLPCTTCPYAEEGINKYLVKDIGATISCIGRYYLVGDYELVKRPGESIVKDGKNLDSYYLIKWEYKTTKTLVEI